MTADQPLAVYTDVEDLDPAPGIAALGAAGFEVRRLSPTEQVTQDAAGCVAILNGYTRLSAETIAALPALRVIALLSAGTDMVDVPAATRAGVWVTNVVDAATEDVAAHAWMLALTLLRGLAFYHRLDLATEWNLRPEPAPRRLSTVRLGLIGMGRIGAALARLANGSVADIVAYDPNVRSWPDGVRSASFDEVVQTSNVLSLHLPLTPETTHLVNASVLAAMPQDAFLVNVSRGALVDSAALLAALNAGHLAGAGLDVLEQEPPDPEDALLRHPKVWLTPHVGYLSQASARAYIDVQARNVVQWATTGRPLSPVNEPAEGHR